MKLRLREMRGRAQKFHKVIIPNFDQPKRAADVIEVQMFTNISYLLSSSTICLWNPDSVTELTISTSKA